MNKRIEEGVIYAVWRLGLLDYYEARIMFSIIAVRRMYEDWE
jgi:hypothetical protein